MSNPLVIDISHHQADPVDFAKIKANGTIGVILKATEGTSYTDPTYAKRRDAARAAGLGVSAYHFLKPGSIVQQMQYFAKQAGMGKGDRLVIDYEHAGLKLPDLETAVSALRDAAPGVEITIYGASGFLGAQLAGVKNEKLAACSLWVASYTTRSEPTMSGLKGTWPVWSLWQYTDKGDVVGIKGPIDSNRWNGGDLSLRGWFHLEDAAAPVPTPEPVEDTTVVVALTAPKNVTIKVTLNGNPVD